MEKLSTIQKRNNLNEIYRVGEQGPGGAYHDYDIYPAGFDPLTMLGEVDPDNVELPLACIEFQKGSRIVKTHDGRRDGVLDTDLLEIVRDRLKAFNDGPMASREGYLALQHVEEALMWLNRRAEDRAERNVLGTMQK